MAKFTVKELDSNNKIDWENFNSTSEDGSFFHTLKWKDILENSFHYTSHYFLVYYGNTVIAACPLYEKTAKGFKGLTTLPNSDCAHIIITKQYCENLVTQIILNKAKDLSKKFKLKFLQITTTSDKIKEYLNTLNFLPSFEKGNMALNLKENNQKKIWDVIFTEKGGGVPRKYIKRFERDGIKIYEAKTIDDLKLFYTYYKKNLEFLKETPYPFSHFENCWNNYDSTEMRVTLLQKNNEFYGGLCSFIFLPKKTMYLKYLALNRKISNTYHPPFALYWDAIIKATEMNLEYICFGGTSSNTDNSTHRIKMKFGAYYEKEYQMILPLNYIFNIGYRIYMHLKNRVV